MWMNWVCGCTVDVWNNLFIPSWWRKCCSFDIQFAKKMWKIRISKLKHLRNDVFIEFDESENRKRPDQSEKKKNYWPIRQAHEISILNRIYSHSMLDFGPLAVMSQCCRYVGCCDLLIRIENARHFVNGVWWHVILCSGMWRWHTMHDAGAYMRHNKQ